jgi:hypothetical protein
MGCPGCLITEKERQQLIDQVSENAKKDAIKKGIFMVIYALPDGTVSYMAADAARGANITPLGYISHLEPVAHGAVPKRTVRR